MADTANGASTMDSLKASKVSYMPLCVDILYGPRSLSLLGDFHPASLLLPGMQPGASQANNLTVFQSFRSCHYRHAVLIS